MCSVVLKTTVVHLQKEFDMNSASGVSTDRSLPVGAAGQTLTNPQMTTLSNRLLDEDGAAEMLGCSPALMRKFRRVGGGPAFCRIGRLVRYQLGDLEAFIEAKKERVAEEAIWNNHENR